jgi:formylglycine-generating enzyme required for sulfatase activity
MPYRRKLGSRYLLAATISLAGLGPVAGPAFSAADIPSESTAGLPGSVIRDCADDCPELVVIGPGQFQMGATEREEKREKSRTLERDYPLPRHRVTIEHKFALGKYPVTRAEFSAFVEETHYQVGDDCSSFARLNNLPALAVPRVNWRDPGFPQTDRDPVICVNRNDIDVYLGWLSRKARHRYRLPSEAEWEYAARAGTSTTRYWGDGTTKTCRYANVADLSYLKMNGVQPRPGVDLACSDGYAFTSPVDAFPPNAFGLHDMLGNVRQFTEDCWNYNYLHAPADGSAWLSGFCLVRVTRGGTYQDWLHRARAAYRSSSSSTHRGDHTGFRVARDF